MRRKIKRFIEHEVIRALDDKTNEAELIIWHKMDEKAIVPTKREEDAGFDIYTIEDNVTLAPGEKHLFKTGIQAMIPWGYWLMGMDRGSTGSRGLHIHCGIVDNGYRGEIFVCLSNDNTFPVKISSVVQKPSMVDGILYYPQSKAIAQLILVPQPHVIGREATDELWKNLNLLSPTERSDGKLGSSNK